MQLGKLIDKRYEIQALLGEGGMASVYRAQDTRLGRTVAIKFIRRRAIPEEQAELVLKRFHKEAVALARLNHPNIITLHDYGEFEGSPYFVMEYAPHGSLAERMGKHILYTEAAKIILPIVRALAYAHGEGVLHRDVKPANILFAVGEQPKLSDFGIAKLLEEDEANTNLTKTGVAIGTPKYMAPEQWIGKAMPQTDVYAMGCVLYEMVCGCAPYNGDTPFEIHAQQLTQPIRKPSEHIPTIPRKVEEVLLKSMAREKDERIGAMFELANELESWLDGIAGINTTRGNTHKISLAPGVEMEFVRVPAGVFLMGSDKSKDPDAWDNELPQHEVYLDEYWIGKYPVTNAQYEVFVKAKGHRLPIDWENGKIPSAKEKHPVTQISWYDASAFCDWVCKVSKQRISLPSEAQWEKAARGTDWRIYPWGNEAPTCSLANYSGCGNTTKEVGSLSQGASPYGALDMAGNVWEWVQDWYAKGYYANSARENPAGPDTGVHYVVRGGSWVNGSWYLRASVRSRVSPTYWLKHNFGFRCVR